MRAPDKLLAVFKGASHSIFTDRSTPSGPELNAAVKRATRDLDCMLIFEPGRVLVGNAGILVTRVEYVKRTGKKNFVIVDGAMNDLIRPTLYDAYHEILAVDEARNTTAIEADVVGPVCETGDYFAKSRRMPKLQQGDLIAIMTAGAYGAVQSGTYNTRPLITEVLVKGDQFAVVRPRQTYEELIGLDQLAPWQ